MPFVPYNLRLIADILKRIDADPARVGKILTFSYPDVIATLADLHDIFGDRTHGIAMRADGNKTINWHKANSIIKEVPDTKALFSALGYHMDAFDITEGRGGEIRWDLSKLLPEDHPAIGAYDLVFDIVSNQCFNIANAWENLSRCCRDGGYVFSITPATIINQGFWNVNPCAYIDYFTNNGFEIVYHRLVEGVYTFKRDIPFEPVNRMRGLPDDSMNIFVARKLKTSVSVWPIMTKFLRNPKAQFDNPR